LSCIHGIEYHEAGVLRPAIGIDEAALVRVCQRLAAGMARQVDAAGRRQALAPAEVVVQQQASADQPGWSQAARMRHDKAQRPDDMRRDAPEYFAFPQRLAYQAELVILQIAQTAMDQLGAG